MQNIEYIIKAGEFVKNKENIDLQSQGLIYWSNGKVEKKDGNELIISNKKDFYQKYYSIFYDTLKISIDQKYLRKIN